jgi:hypothetical protein
MSNGKDVESTECQGKCFGKFDGALDLLAADFAARAIPDSRCAALSALVYDLQGGDGSGSTTKGWVRSGATFLCACWVA